MNNLLQSVINNPIAQSVANNPITQSVANNPITKSLENDAYQKYVQLINSGYIPKILIDGVNYKLNTLKSDILPTDKQYIGAVAPPTTIDLRSQLLPIRNQGSVSSCVSFSTSCMREYLAHSNYYLSPAFIYHSRSNSPQDCMTIKNALDILSLSGVCYDNTYSYSNISTTGSLPQNAVNEAIHFKIASYAQINDINSLKNALQTYGPCPISFPVYNFSNQLWIQNPGDTFHGGHCMLVVGYDDSSFIIRNSWGMGWGNQGYTNFPFSQWGVQWEVWTCTGYPPPGSILPPPVKSTSSSTHIIMIIVCIICCLLLLFIAIAIYNRNR